jgi:hypothetical protein
VQDHHHPAPPGPVLATPDLEEQPAAMPLRQYNLASFHVVFSSAEHWEDTTFTNKDRIAQGYLDK